MSTQFDIADGAIRIGHPVSGGVTIIRASHPAALRFVDTVADEMPTVCTRVAPFEPPESTVAPDLPPIEYRDAGGALQSTPAH